MGSILRDWVMELPIREQGVLISAARGCDITEKPREAGSGAIERHLVAYLRWCFMYPADERELEVPGAFIQVVGVRHPFVSTRKEGELIYRRMANSLHLRPEATDVYLSRLSEDRIASGTVVS